MSKVRILLSALIIFTIPVSALSDPDSPKATLGAATSQIYEYAKDHNFVFYRTQEQVQQALESKALVPLDDFGVDGNYEVITNDGPQHVLPEVAIFASRLGRHVWNANCGPLIIVQGVNLDYLPLKTDRRSHHATGLAIDIAVNHKFGSNCHVWLELTLLQIETAGRIDISTENAELYEKKYPGYHVNVFVKEYAAWLKGNT